MSDAENKTDKIERIRLEELEQLEDTGKMILRANEALAVHELRRMLERQAERDIVIDEMRRAIDNIAVSHVMAIEEIKTLKNAHGVLLRQQAELYARQGVIAALCDVFVAKLDETNQAREALAAEVADRD